jgi:hypothetical protein
MHNSNHFNVFVGLAVSQLSSTQNSPSSFFPFDRLDGPVIELFNPARHLEAPRLLDIRVFFGFQV